MAESKKSIQTLVLRAFGIHVFSSVAVYLLCGLLFASLLLFNASIHTEVLLIMVIASIISGYFLSELETVQKIIVSFGNSIFSAIFLFISIHIGNGVEPSVEIYWDTIMMILIFSSLIIWTPVSFIVALISEKKSKN